MATQGLKRWIAGGMSGGLSVLTAVTFAACGQQPSLPPPPLGNNISTPATTTLPTGGCGPGQYTPYCISAPSLAQACAIVRGQMLTVNGQEVCRTDLDLTYQYTVLNFSGYMFPKLSPNEPQSMTAFRTGLPVKAGDRLIWSASGGWGGLARDSYSFLGIPVTSYSLRCDDFTLSGYKSGTRYTYDGYPSQLYGTDGTHVFALGTTASHTFQADGQLALGFNVDPRRTDYCSQLTLKTAKVRHCEDANRVTHPCP